MSQFWPFSLTSTSPAVPAIAAAPQPTKFLTIPEVERDVVLSLSLWGGSTNIKIEIPTIPSMLKAQNVSLTDRQLSVVRTLALGTDAIWNVLTDGEFASVIKAQDAMLIETALRTYRLMQYEESCTELARERDMEENVLYLIVSRAFA